MPINIDSQYKDLLKEILQSEDAYSYLDVKRDEICHQINSYELKHDMRKSFPLIQLKKLNLKNIFAELIWFLKGDNNILNLNREDCKIWNDDVRNFVNRQLDETDKYSEEEYESYVKELLNHENLYYTEADFLAGDIYGVKWRNWTGLDINGKRQNVDQLEHLIETIKKVPINRRSLVNAWDAVSIQPDNSALPPCHWAFEILPFAKKDGTYGFDLKWHQRSVDTFLGLPYNIASYGLLMLILSKILRMEARYLIGDLSNVHIYNSHVKQCELLISREVEENNTEVNLNSVLLNCLEDATALKFTDLTIENYNPQGFVKAKMLSITNPDWDK